MSELTQKKCEACKVGSPQVTEEEKETYLASIPKWSIILENGVQKLKRDFSFKNFKEALVFTNKLGIIAEDEAHHPDITTRYGSVSVIWYTHTIKGLHLNDFIMAAKTDLIV